MVAYSATPDGSRLALVISTPTVLGDLYVLDAASGAADAARPPQRGALLAARADRRPRRSPTRASTAGRSTPSCRSRPDYEAGKKYPLILNIHGGPHAAYGYTFFHEMQWMAAKGYVVLYPNPRGSSTYGQEFGNVIQYHYPGDDAKDLLAGVDEMVKRGHRRSQAAGGDRRQRRRHPHQLDRHPDRPLRGGGRPALDRRLVELLVHRRLHPLPPDLVPRRALGGPAGLRRAARRSPTSTKITTPLMLIEGEADYRTPARRRRRADVPRPEVPEEAGR